MNHREDRHADSGAAKKFEVAELSEGCQEKLKEFEKELNRMGCWNIALVAYQMKN